MPSASSPRPADQRGSLAVMATVTSQWYEIWYHYDGGLRSGGATVRYVPGYIATRAVKPG